jgi:hypothetical protein
MMVFNLQALTRMKLMLSLIELLDVKVNQTITSGCGAVAAHRRCEPIAPSSENLVKHIGFASMLHTCDNRRMKKFPGATRAHAWLVNGMAIAASRHHAWHPGSVSG